MAASVQASTRPFQVVVWGASGFAGRLVCEHLATSYQGRVKWAIAGRDVRKLEGVREELARNHPAVKDIPILVADANDSVAVGKVLSQTQCVLALVGPFALHGSNVVEQAVEQGTHYADITGEVPWVKRSMEKHHAKAKAKGVKIVHCCGYDSVPSDLGTLMMVEHCQKKLRKKVSQVYGLIGTSKGGFSGGTLASGINIFESETPADLAAIGSDAYYLAGVHGGKGSDKPAPFSPKYLPEPKTWAGPFVMEGCNAKIVQLSNTLYPQGPYGKDFKYCEMWETGQGWSGWLAASAISMVMKTIGAIVLFHPTRALLKRVLPGSGTGPSLEVQRTGCWTTRMVAVTEAGPGEQPIVVTGVCGDKRDPGYWSTSRMLLETGLALVLDADKIASSGTCQPGGVLTPATAAGNVLIERLRGAGFTFKVDA